ncbi:MAG TPA: helix-turn-helix transcriptional regulator [Candidatus Obscuribacterales bacterium]
MANSRNTAGNKQRKKGSSETTGYPRERYESSGNVFRDMGKSDEDATNLFMRSQLMMAIEDVIKERGWTQAQAATVMGVARPRIAELLAGRIDLFSLDTLVKYLRRLGKQVTLVVGDADVA